MSQCIKILVLFTFILQFYDASSATKTIQLDLANLDHNNGSLNIFYNLSSYETIVNVVNIEKTNYFVVLQVHSFVSNVSISSDKNHTIHNTVYGTNVGLVALTNGMDAINFYVNKYDKTDVRALFAVAVYDKKEPIPGGCNMVFNTEIAPYMQIKHTPEMITVNFQPASANKVSCNNDVVDIDIYQLFLKEHDYTMDAYFHGLLQMLTVEDIRKNGIRVSKLDGKFKYCRMFSNYVGNGEVFAIVATYKGRSSPYVPIVSYGFNLDARNIGKTHLGKSNAPDMVFDHIRILITFIPIPALFLLFFGHRCFRTTVFIVGVLTGFLITFMMLKADPLLNYKESINISLGMGVIYGIFWSFMWWNFGVPLLSVQFTNLLSGYLLAAILFYSTGISEVPEYHYDLNYWVTFICIVLSFAAVLCIFTVPGHIFSCCFVGSYICVFSLNSHIGSNLHYILINVLRRATIKNFNWAVVTPPYQRCDLYQTIFWLFLCLAGFGVQYSCQRGRAPFPPPRFNFCPRGTSGTNTPSRFSSSERTPLLGADADLERNVPTARIRGG